MIAALGLDDFVGVRVQIALKSPGSPLPFATGHFLGSAGRNLRPEQSDDLRQAYIVLTHKRAQFVFELGLGLEGLVIFEGFQDVLLFGDQTLEFSVLGDFGHGRILSE